MRGGRLTSAPHARVRTAAIHGSPAASTVRALAYARHAPAGRGYGVVGPRTPGSSRNSTTASAATTATVTHATT